AQRRRMCLWGSFILSAVAHAAALAGLLTVSQLATALAPPTSNFRQGESAIVTPRVKVDVPPQPMQPEARPSPAAPVATPPVASPIVPDEAPTDEQSATESLRDLTETICDAIDVVDIDASVGPSPPDTSENECVPPTLSPAKPAEQSPTADLPPSPSPPADVPDTPKAPPMPPIQTAAREPGVQAATPSAPIVPRYPPASVRRGHEGLVVVRATVRADGGVSSATVEQSSGHRRLDRAACDAVGKSHFIPARREGRTVACTVSVPVRFSLR
ncbi:MAG: energy transducer TonB, partial [Phycisphaerae bacterium]|nr:energy transducer TonB [Phycisphaerae bacterium]